MIDVFLVRKLKRDGKIHEANQLLEEYHNTIIDDYKEIRKNMTRNRVIELYEKRKNNGFCVSCGKIAPEEGKIRCESCLLKRRKWQKERHKRKKDERNNKC